ncbi:MAG: hypothetical protein OEV14_11265, partial [Gammaproteobacteria bacterium]|nr:hypothetical protein [Gammaproteobacteria bacterium]
MQMPAALHVPPAQVLIAVRGTGAEKIAEVLVVASGLSRPAVSVAGQSAWISCRCCVPLAVSRIFYRMPVSRSMRSTTALLAQSAYIFNGSG